MSICCGFHSVRLYYTAGWLKESKTCSLCYYISATCGNNCMNFVTVVHTAYRPVLWKRIWNIDKIMQFRPSHAISQRSERCLPLQSVAGCEKRRFIGELERPLELLQMVQWPSLAVTYTVKCLMKFVTTLLMSACDISSSQMVCMATFTSSIVLRFYWSLWYIFSMTPQTWQFSGFKSGEVWRPLILFNEFTTVF